MAVITSAQVVPPAQHLCFQGLKDRTSLQKSANKGRVEPVHGGSGLYPTPCDLPRGPSSVTAGVLHACHGLKIDLKQGEVTMIPGLTTA